jgi:hypothetical protein
VREGEYLSEEHGEGGSFVLQMYVDMVVLVRVGAGLGEYGIVVAQLVGGHVVSGVRVAGNEQVGR